MRLLPLLVLFLLVGSLGAAEPEPTLPPEYRRAMREASEAFDAKDFATAHAKLKLAEAAAPDTSAAANIRAAILVDEKRFAEADKVLDELLAREPKFFPARFNKNEILFLQAKYPEALVGFQELLAENPRQEFLQFKVILTHLMAKDDASARKLLDAMKFPSDTPSYYFAQAAWEFAHGNTKEAHRWLHSAQAIFTPTALKLPMESLADLGWIKVTDRF